MKYGILFVVAAVLLVMLVVSQGGWTPCLLWPATSLAVVGAGYLGLGANVFGKRPDGRQSLPNVVLLLPYLLVNWGVWHLLRLLQSEDALNRVDEDLWLARRLFAHEVPEEVGTVVDLTCEFAEPAEVAKRWKYLSIPILDGHVPDETTLLAAIDALEAIAETEGPLLLHCAQGHGRTGLVGTLLLIALRKADSVAEALGVLQAARPKLWINKSQTEMAETAAQQILSRRADP